MASINLIEAFQEFKDAENIDRPTMMKVVEDVFKTLLRKKYGSDDNFDVIVNAEKGDLEIMRRRMIVNDGEVNDPLAEIAYVVDEATFQQEIARRPALVEAWGGTINAGATLVQATQESRNFTGAVNLVRAVPTVSWLAVVV